MSGREGSDWAWLLERCKQDCLVRSSQRREWPKALHQVTERLLGEKSFIAGDGL